MPLFEGYRSRGTWIDRIDPRTKLAWLILTVTLALTIEDWRVLVLLPTAVLTASLIAGIPLRTLYNPLMVLVVIALQLFIVQLLFNREGTVLFHAGPLNVYSGAFPATYIAALKLSAIALAGMQFMLWTPPSDMTLLIVKAGVSYRFAMLVGLALRFLPLMEKELAAIYESQGARGLVMKSAVQKLKGLLPIVLPFLYRSFRRANETALAMELRGFGCFPQRTFLYDLEIRAREMAVIALMSGVAVGAVVHKIKPLWL